MGKHRAFIFLFAVFVLIFSYHIFFSPNDQPLARAGFGDNVSGWVWSSTIGWISINCTNQGSCASSDYGVNVDASGNASGYAWSSNVGWITFNPSGPYPSAPENGVQVDFVTGAVTGWARVYACVSPGCAGGWDGWIKMAGPGYGVAIDPVTCSTISGSYAWGGGDDANFVGWINFRGADYGMDINPSRCVQPPLEPSNLGTSPDPPDYCLDPPWTVNFAWDYSDPNVPPSGQQGYEIEIDNNSDFSSPEFGQAKSPYANPSDIITIDPTLLQAGVNYWRVRATNELGRTSLWSNEGATPELPSLTIPLHPLPKPVFDYSPKSVSAGVTIEFADQTVFDPSSDPASHAWLWDFGDGTPPSSLQNPTHLYSNPGTYSVILTATDDAGTCPIDPPVSLNAKPKLPKYREVPPR